MTVWKPSGKAPEWTVSFLRTCPGHRFPGRYRRVRGKPPPGRNALRASFIAMSARRNPPCATRRSPPAGGPAPITPGTSITEVRRTGLAGAKALRDRSRKPICGTGRSRLCPGTERPFPPSQEWIHHQGARCRLRDSPCLLRRAPPLSFRAFRHPIRACLRGRGLSRPPCRLRTVPRPRKAQLRRRTLQILSVRPGCATDLRPLRGVRPAAFPPRLRPCGNSLG